MKPTAAHQPGKHLPGLDHLRALAIMLVFLYHYGRLFPHPEWTNTLGKFGWTGVDLFFVLSGYLIAGSLFEEMQRTGTIPLRRFYTKRFWRIIPPYLLVLALYFLFPQYSERSTPAPLWKFLSFTQNIGLDLSTQGSFSHAWSLCIEEQFYALFPLLLLALPCRKNRYGLYFWLLLVSAGLAIRYWSYTQLAAPFLESDSFAIRWMQWIYYPTWCRLDGLLVGVGIAALAAYRKRLFARLLAPGNYLLLCAGAALAAAYVLCTEEWSFAASVAGYPLVAAGYGILLLAALSAGCALSKRAGRISQWLAAHSYALYLLHKLAIHNTQRLLAPFANKESNGVLICCLASSLLAAWLLRRLVEKPALQIRERVLRKKRATAGQPLLSKAHLP